MGLPVALLCACLWGAFASAHPALDVTYQIDEVYALGVHATFSAGVPPNTTLSWRRADGQGAPVAIGLQAGATQARLLRFTPKQEYIFTLSAGTAAAGGRAGYVEAIRTADGGVQVIISFLPSHVIHLQAASWSLWLSKPVGAQRRRRSRTSAPGDTGSKELSGAESSATLGNS